jgi:hypothetical protein
MALKIITEREFSSMNSKYVHLFDVNLPSQDMVDENKDWVIRESFLPFGPLMVGDLRVIKPSTDVFEIHPFPEWVVQIYMPQKKPGSVYALVPDWDSDIIGQFAKKVWGERLLDIQNQLNRLTLDDVIAIKYEVGTSIKIPANVPHEFISVVNPGEDIPFCQVFEPNDAGIVQAFKITMPVFRLPFSIQLN